MKVPKETFTTIQIVFNVLLVCWSSLIQKLKYIVHCDFACFVLLYSNFIPFSIFVTNNKQLLAYRY